MRYTFLGAGLMARAGARWLLRQQDTTSILLVDRLQSALDAATYYLADDRVTATLGDLTDPADLARVLTDVDGVFNAAHYGLNEAIIDAAIAAKVHYVDLGGNTAIVRRQLERDAKAVAAGVTALPDCGLAPGLANVIGATLIRELGQVDELHIRVGGLPQHPEPPLDYRLLFSPAGLINEYKEPAVVLHEGRIEGRPPLGDLESLEWTGLPPLEAFNTYGGTSTMPDTYQGRIRELTYKTIRYQGHQPKIRLLFDLGLDGEEPGPAGVAPRTILEERLAAVLPHGGPDLTLVRVTAKGPAGGRTWEILDRAEADGTTSMMRMTAYPTAALLRRACHGEFPPGAMAPEQLVVGDPFYAELAESGITITRSAD